MDIVERRYQITLAILETALPPPSRILDLGVDNPLARRMRDRGYDVINTPDVDLDFSPSIVRGHNVDAVTAFEILEHLINPFSVLCEIEAPLIIATVPLRLWFKTAYRNASDILDQHYHEFETWQFDQLLEKSGWNIRSTETWTGPTGKIGVRPLFRRYTPRYYGVVAERTDSS